MLPLFVKAQREGYEMFPTEDGKITYTKIVNVDSTSKEKLYLKIKKWAVDSYGQQSATLQADDKEAGYIAYKGFLQTFYKYPPMGLLKLEQITKRDVYHTLKFFIKDNKVKIVMSDFKVKISIEDFSIENNLDTYLEENALRMKGASKKSIAKLQGYDKEYFVQLNTELTALMNGIEAKLTIKKKSEFDF